MSIAVPLDDLADAVSAHPWGYLVTVGADARPRLIAVPTEMVDGCLRCVTGATAREHVVVHPEVTMVFPPADGVGFSLIVDGVAELHTDAVLLRPTWAVLHRPALPDQASRRSTPNRDEKSS